MAARGNQGEMKQQRHHPARAGLVREVFPQRGDAQGQRGVGGIHASFFATGRVSDAVRRSRNVSDRSL